MSNFLAHQQTPARDKGYMTARAGRRWVLTNPTPGTGILSATGTSFDETKPQVIIYQAGAAAATDVWKVILVLMNINQVSTQAGGAINIAVYVDSTNRYSSGGTALTPQKMMAQTGATVGFTARTGATATAAGTTHRKVYEGSFAAVTGTALPTIDFLDACGIGKTGSILIYIWAATTAPTLTFAYEVTEEADVEALG